MTTKVGPGVLAANLQDHFRNRIINPSGRVYQRAVAATADDTYFADRWYILSQTNTVTPSALSDPEDGYPKGIRITQSQAVAQRFGYAQIIEGANCKDLRGQSGVFTPRIRVSNSQAIRYAILGWTSTEDSVTSDVVNDWTSSTYTAGNFFLASNLTVIAVGSQTPAANTWTTLTGVTGSLGSTFNNIIVMVWTEGTAAQNFTLDFDFNQFEQGTATSEFLRRPMTTEIQLCQRYYQQVPAYDTQFANGVGWFYTTRLTFETQMRATPTTSTFTTGTNTNVGGAPTFSGGSKDFAIVTSNTSSGSGQYGHFGYVVACDAEL